MSKSAEYVSANTIRKHYDISQTTLRNWANEGKIGFVRTKGGKKAEGKRLYRKEDVDKLFGEPNKASDKKTRICYARVSSQGQKDDLVRQVDYLKEQCPGYEIIQDVGSGLNFKRKGFLKLIDKIIAEEIDEIVICHKDRLCRFGYELVEYLCEQKNIKIRILGAGDSNEGTEEKKKNETEELSEDLISIVTVFVARSNGKRSGENKRKRKRESEKKEKDKQRKTNED